jgi:hypothetical protein
VSGANERLVLTADADGIRTITLNRPEARNAFDTELYRPTGPLASLRPTKHLLRAGWLDAARAARHREEEVFSTLLGQGGSQAALAELLSR